MSDLLASSPLGEVDGSLFKGGSVEAFNAPHYRKKTNDRMEDVIIALQLFLCSPTFREKGVTPSAVAAHPLIRDPINRSRTAPIQVSVFSANI